MQLHKLRPIFQLRGGNARKSLHIYGMLRFVLQQ